MEEEAFESTDDWQLQSAVLADLDDNFEEILVDDDSDQDNQDSAAALEATMPGLFIEE